MELIKCNTDSVLLCKHYTKETLYIHTFFVSLLNLFDKISRFPLFSVPEEFNFDPVSKSYGSPERRPEIKSATIEFVAPSEYMVCTDQMMKAVTVRTASVYMCPLLFN